jgi:CRP-like cAMP-binding protein
MYSEGETTMGLEEVNCQQEKHNDNQKSCVSLVPVFNHLEDAQMDEIIVVAQSITYKKREIIFHSGDKSDALYIVNNGKIKIYHLTASGKEQLVRILLPGDFTGELDLFKESTHKAYTEAMVDTQVSMIKRNDIQSFLLKNPSVALKILSEFSMRLEKSETQTTRFATEKVETRISLFLAECIEGEDQSKEINLPMSKKDLASYLGTTPEIINQRLSDLEEQGLIKQKTQRKIDILDLDGLLLLK